MLIHLQATLVFSFLSCLVSAFSTRFLIEGVDEVGKTPIAKEAKMQKTEKNDTIENKDNIHGMEMEVIPIVTDIFTQPEDLFNMTPLKLVAAISAQHLITTVKNIPVAGNSYEDSLDMLENVVREFNKTAEIIKLTAKYVNISGHYMLSTLKEFTEESCDVKSLDEAMKSVRRSFLKTITDHAIGAVKELNEKTRDREISGSDILISSSYHIVSAFQEMTSKVMTLTEESRRKCKEPSTIIDITSPSSEKYNVSEQNTQNIFSFQPIPQQGKQHKSIKKDQAQSKTQEKVTQTKFGIFHDQTLENFNSQDLTVEILSPETILKANNAHLSNQNGRNQLKVPEDLTVEYIPLNGIFPQKTENAIPTQTTNENVTKKESKINQFEKCQDDTRGNFNNQGLTVEVYSPGTNLQPNGAQLSDEQDRMNKLKDLKMELIPLKKIYMFNPKNGLSPAKPKENINQKPSSTINKIEIFQDQTPVNDNKNQFTVEVLSPNKILSNQKDEISKSKLPEDLQIEYNQPKKLSLLQNSKSDILFETPKEDHTIQKTTTKIDRELDSSAVDSLSNVPSLSSEIETTDTNKDKVVKAVTEKLLLSPKTEMNTFDILKDPYLNQNMKKTYCNGQMDPVCGFDEKNKKLIIFYNDCRREAYNKISQTNYSAVNMDNCVSLFLRTPAVEAKPLNSLHRSLDLRPR